MVHIIFDGSQVKLDNYFRQEGSGPSTTYFEGLPAKYQRGMEVITPEIYDNVVMVLEMYSEAYGDFLNH